MGIYAKAISDTEAKLKRQEEQVAATKNLLEGLRELDNPKPREAPNATGTSKPQR